MSRPRRSRRFREGKTIAPRWILVIDDSPFVLALMSDMLCGPNYEVTTAPDALQGFIQARDLKPLIVISDMEMPGYGTGDVGLKDLRKDPRLRHIPFIFVTSMDQEKAKLLLPQGDPTVRLMSKPVDWVKLRAWIKEMCGLEIPERVPEAG